MRSTRNQPFCWQEKSVLRLLRANFAGSELVKLRTLYATLTEIDSDFNNQDIKYFTKTISTYSGLSKEWIPTGLRIFENLKMIQIIEEREGGKFKGKKIVFTPENIDEMGISTVTVKSLNGKPVNGFLEPSEDILYQEDIINQEDHGEDLKKTLDIFENLFKEFEINYTRTNQESVKVLLKTMTEKQVIDYLIETYEELKKARGIKSIARAFSSKIQKGERQLNTKPKVKTEVKVEQEVNNPIIVSKEKPKKTTLGEKDLEPKDDLTLLMEAVSKELRKQFGTKEFLNLNKKILTKTTVEEIKEFAKEYNIKI